MTTLDVEVGHLSMQFSDSRRQWKIDAEKVFRQGYDWVTGTEAGDDADYRIVRQAARKHGYKIHRMRGNWVAVHKSLVKFGTYRRGRAVVEEKEDFIGKGHDRSLVWATFVHVTPGVGKLSVIGSHYPTKGRPDAKNPIGRRNLSTTRKMGREISKLMLELGDGAALAFYGGDQNMVDKNNDTFAAGPVISCWDELEKWPLTAPFGNYDLIARLVKDRRVKCLRARAYNDKDMFFHTDHFLIEAKYEIKLLGGDA